MRKDKNKNTEKKFFEYKGGELKNFYNKYILRGMIFSLALHIAVIGGWLFSSMTNDATADKDETYTNKIIEVDFIPPIVEKEEQITPKVEKKKVVPKKDLEALTPKPVKKEVSDNITTKTQEQLDKIDYNVSSKGDENANNTVGDGDLVLKEEKIEENVKKEPVKEEVKKGPYQTFEVQVAPQVTNLGSVQGSLNYPQMAIDQGIEGRVVAKVLVNESGRVTRVGGVSGPSVFHSEVRDKVRDLVFTPAMQNGKTVPCWVNVPFNFKLKGGF